MKQSAISTLFKAPCDVVYTDSGNTWGHSEIVAVERILSDVGGKCLEMQNTKVGANHAVI
jgi:hypothetical protein